MYFFYFNCLSRICFSRTDSLAAHIANSLYVQDAPCLRWQPNSQVRSLLLHSGAQCVHSFDAECRYRLLFKKCQGKVMFKDRAGSKVISDFNTTSNHPARGNSVMLQWFMLKRSLRISGQELEVHIQKIKEF